MRIRAGCQTDLHEDSQADRTPALCTRANTRSVCRNRQGRPGGRQHAGVYVNFSSALDRRHPHCADLLSWPSAEHSAAGNAATAAAGPTSPIVGELRTWPRGPRPRPLSRATKRHGMADASQSASGSRAACLRGASKCVAACRVARAPVQSCATAGERAPAHCAVRPRACRPELRACT